MKYTCRRILIMFMIYKCHIHVTLSSYSCSNTPVDYYHDSGNIHHDINNDHRIHFYKEDTGHVRFSSARPVVCK